MRVPRSRAVPAHMCLRLVMLGVLLLLGRTALAETYYTVAKGGFDVMAPSPGRALTLAQHLARLDNALTSLLHLPPQRLPTHIYVLPGAEEKATVGDFDVAASRFDGFDVSVVADVIGSQDNPDWSALWGYTHSLLQEVGDGRLPHWFNVGIEHMFADSEFDVHAVRTGEFRRGWIRLLNRNTRFPMEEFLRLTAGDPRLRDAGVTRERVFGRQSWLLVHSIYVEGYRRAEFEKYLGLIREGKSEADAFQAAFPGMTYADLDFDFDDMLTHIDSGQRRPYVFVVPMNPEPAEAAAPVRLSGAESEARIAGLQLLFGRGAQALARAKAALQADPQNEQALRVLARASLYLRDYAAALSHADELGRRAAPSAAALTDRGDVLAGLAASRDDTPAALHVSRDSLRQSAREAYDTALSLDGDNLRAWAGMAGLFTKDERSAAAAFVARVQPVMDRHLDSPQLARPLAQLCRRTGQTDCARHFGEIWRSNARGQRGLAEAEQLLGDAR